MLGSKLKYLFILVIALLCASCSTTNNAPVNNGTYPLTKSGYYRVRHGDTLYSIAFAYGYDYRALAKINGIIAPYHVNAGRLLLIRNQLQADRRRLRRHHGYILRSSPRHRSTYKNYSRSQLSPMQRSSLRSRTKASRQMFGSRNSNNMKQSLFWQWPAVGKVLNYYSPITGNKGINIIGQVGEPIRAAAAGMVVYAGTGLRAYGQLIIIKHSNAFLSAYAHNQKIFVTEGQTVHLGQKIALMGNTGSTRTMLHFEIRKAGQSVNPLKYLPGRIARY